MRSTFFFLTTAALLAASNAPRTQDKPERPSAGEGMLVITDPYGKATGEKCPLKHTAVRGEISGPLARVTVTQEFQNPSTNKIEAVYIFPLPQLGAVDDMTIETNGRKIRALIKPRDEARRVYEDARNRGHVAALLEQNRPNIFQQSVANIEPGATVKVTISYVETVKYDTGVYEWSFPMTVGPRYMPAHMANVQLNPKYARPETRAGHDLSLELKIDSGVAFDEPKSTSHDIAVTRLSSSRANVVLRAEKTILNKDFVLRYNVAGAEVRDAVLTHHDARGGFFSLILQPPARVTHEDVMPKELVFVIDTSGSMSGFPIEKAKETMKLAIDGLYPRDTFNLITFAGDTHVLFPEPVPATPENLARAQAFLASRAGGGGTEMMKAIRAALAPSANRDAVRIVCFMTDGYVGNDMEIIGEIRRNPGARIFSFGIGSSVNRFLLDKMAEEGRGEVEYVALSDDGSAAARRFHERVRNPLLTDVAVDFGRLNTSDVYPARIPDLFSAKPVVIHGRYNAAGSGVIRLTGKMSGKPFSREIRVNFPANEPAHDTLATLWARSKVEALMSRDWASHQGGAPAADVKAGITRLGVDYRLMTQYTAFVAVDESRVTEGGKPVTVEVAVEMPDGVSHEGVFGQAAGKSMAMAPSAMPIRGGNRAAAEYRRSDAAAQVASKDEHNEEADRKKANKLDPALSARLAAAAPTDKIRIEVWLADAEPATIEALKKAGFEDDGKALVAKIRTGMIRADKLAALEKLIGVVRIRLVV